MIIKQGEFMSFTPAELHARMPKRKPVSRPATTQPPAKPEMSQTKTDLLREVERLVRENERLVLERDQLRDELSRHSFQVRQAKQSRKATPPEEPVAPQTSVENLRRQPVSLERETEIDPDDPGYELARVVVKWFWEDADEASVRLVHDALVGQGIRTLVRDDDEDAS